MSNWLKGKLEIGKRIKCEICNRTHQWDALPTEESGDSFTNDIFRSPTYASYGIWREPHIGERYIVARDYSYWLIKYRKRLIHKSHRSTCYYTEYVALCPEHASVMFGRHKIDDIEAFYPIPGTLAFSPIDYDEETHQGHTPTEQIENETEETNRVFLDDPTIFINDINVGSLIRRKWSLREGHETAGKIGYVKRINPNNGVAIVHYSNVGDRFCQLSRYDKVEPISMGDIEVGRKVYLPTHKLNLESEVEEVINGNSATVNRAIDVQRDYLMIKSYDYSDNSILLMAFEHETFVKVPRQYVVLYDDRELGNHEQDTTHIVNSIEDRYIPEKKGIWIHHNLKLLFD